MKSEFLDVQYFKILPIGSFPEESSREEIILAAQNHPEFSHIVGSPKFITEEKLTDAGRYYVHQFVFSVPSYTTESEMEIIRNAGAVVIYTDVRTLVLYANDIFNNASLKFTAKSNHDVTDYELSRESLFLL